MIKRDLQSNLEKKLFKGKAILLLGPRQVGKTTLIENLLKDKLYLFLDGDDPTVRTILENPNTLQIKQIIGQHKIVFIDEAQRIAGIGITIKIITDQLKDVQVILSGSSSFELSGLMQEPLTGRKWTFHFYPVSWKEWQDHKGFLHAEQDLETRLIYGMYPDVLNHPEEQAEVLKELVDSYLYKDVLAIGGIKKPEIMQKLLQAIAFQLGQEVSYNELASLLKIDAKTVSAYIEILEQAYVIFKLTAFSRNLRNEIKTNRKIYFYDNGVRNTVIGNYQPVSLRQDIGALWENFLISERIKLLEYTGNVSRKYFWRTKQQQEIDYIEELNEEIHAYEFKWNSGKKIFFPKTFSNNYKAKMTGITRKNFREFLIY
ncbi:MAG: ATP-binding protein [Bacteroidota bacterium]|nr:ATP-binding protein [Bacteroidota bacterium]